MKGRFALAIFFCFIIFYMSFGGAVAARERRFSYPPTPEHRKQVLTAIRERREPPGVPFEDLIDEAADWSRHGDGGALDALLDYAPHSDGAGAESLGVFLGEEFLARPTRLLRKASRRPLSERKNLGFILANGDGQGLNQTRKMLRLLREFSGSPNREIARTARIWLDEVKKAAQDFEKQGSR